MFLKQIIPSSSNKLLVPLIAGLWIMSSGFFSAQANAETPSVGVAQLLIGQGATYQRNSKTQPITKGLAINQGDLLKTDHRTHLHLKMEDGALVSIHPSSILEIECYQTHDTKNVCIKFNLISGQVRKISGQASQQSPQSFRLNTPVAAVGVRGTDFITKIQNDDTALVRVIEGAITLTPFDDNCTQGGLGQCNTPLTQVLTEKDLYMLQIQRGGIPQRVELDLNLVNKKTIEQEEQNYATSLVSGVDDAEMNQVLHIIKDDPALVENFLHLAGYKPNIDFNNNEAIKKNTGGLMFGTWSKNTEGLAQPYDMAKQNKTVTVGNADFALWRENGVYMPPVGQVEYKLTQSHAYIEKDDARINASVLAGTLAINFDAQKVNTSLMIQPDQGSLINFNAKDQELRSDGLFSINSSGQRLAVGAVSNNGQEVGYMFDQPVDSGRLKGQTMWQTK